MENKKRILHVLGGTSLGGAESRIMDLYRNLNRDEYQFDFLIHTTKKGHFDDEIISLGGHIYSLPRYRIYNHFSYKKACREFFKAHHDYVAIQGHMTSTAAIYLPIAKKAGIPMTIAHARSAGVDKGIKGYLTKLLRKNLYKRTDMMFACSDLAAQAVFGKKRFDEGRVIVIPNAINVSQYAPNDKIRKQIREQLGLQDCFVIGHVGRFHYAKNHEYLIDIFEGVAKQRADARLLLLGDGPLKHSVEEYARQKGLSEKVLFLGNKTPVAPFYQAMDLFVFPSRYEGMPGTVVEAQAAGLTCLISDRITTEVKATDRVHFLSIDAEPAKWSEQIIRASQDDTVKKDATTQLIDNGFDVVRQIRQYERFYVSGDATIFSHLK